MLMMLMAPLFAPCPPKDCGKYGTKILLLYTYVLIQGQMLLHSDSPIHHLLIFRAT